MTDAVLGAAKSASAMPLARTDSVRDSCVFS
jgi:hypothetical protein